MRSLFASLRVLGIILVAHGLMLLGADEISTIENGGLRTIRSLDTILALYRADPKPWLMALPAAVSHGAEAAFSLPGWLVLFVVGGGLVFVTRGRD